ncbi:spatacsin-like isoform X2 [Tribolium madens]|uniref:spatacsin-like isoform X2 n=1 Tax=Tribolium madens TaxID=41895 RepID=UPI001CF76108|nr:spatacsin-like isoform X2 [Tribolium madens]
MVICFVFVLYRCVVTCDFNYNLEMNPPPPATLNKETIGVWHGWSNVGDKEVAREAAAKGSHVSLAIHFLSLRKRITLEEAQVWFREEVLKWVHELLDRKQIFRASHVLTNIGIDPGAEFSKIFYTTSNKNMREYIGNHLMKIEKLDETLQQLWTFLNLILENAITISKYKLPTESLECLDKHSEGFKAEVATVLLMKTEDTRLNTFLNAETLWKYLLINNDLNNLLLWINIRYKSKIDDMLEGILIDQFKKFAITNEMLNFLADESVATNLRHVLYNELSKFGIFQNEEKNNVILILERLKNSYSLANLYQILGKNQSTINVDHFIKLLIDYCLDKQYYTVLNVCVKNFKLPQDTKELSLIGDFRSLVNGFSEFLLTRNILNVVDTLSNDLITFFNDNPLILLTLLIFTKECDFTKMIEKYSLVINNLNLTDSLINMLKQNEIFNTVCSNKITGPPKCELSIYDLIEKHLKIDKQLLLELKSLNNQLALFYTEVIQKYGYSKKIDYKFYLKEARPSVAAKKYILGESHDLKILDRKNCKLAIMNFDCDEIGSSCVAFSEMVGADSNKVRVLIRVAKILSESKYEKESLLELLLNEDDPYVVQNVLEKILIESIECNPFLSGSQLVQALKLYEITIQFSKITNIKLPELFFKSCASRNLWLPFLLLAQIHDYPLDQIKLLIQLFKSPNMLEHLTHGVVNDIQVEEKNVSYSRKSLMLKVGLHKNLDILNQYASMSGKSQSSLESGGSSSSSDFFEIDVSNIKATLLQTLIRCHNSTDPPKALLQACQLYRNPLLAVFATSYEPDSIITNWLTWLSVSCELCRVFTNYETTAISANSVTNLLEDCLKSNYPKTILESFEIFIPENPLRTFMEFLLCCYHLDFTNPSLVQKLETFQTMLKNLRKNSIISEADHEMTYLNNKIWIETTAIRLLSALLEFNCNSMYEQILIVENLYKIQIWKYFSSDYPNFYNLLEILKALYSSNCGVRLNISLMFETKNSRQAIIQCINALLEKQKFSVALKISQIENLPPDLILTKEWQNKMNDRNDENFWKVCNETFAKHNVTADCIVDFFLECSEQTSDLFEKFTLLKLAWEWSEKYDLSSLYEIEKKMWIAFLYLDDKHRDLDIFDIKESTYLYKDLIEMLKDVSQYESDLSKDLMNQLERIVAIVLNKKNFWLALKLQKMFGCKSADLETLKLCHNLAEGILLPYQLAAEQRLLLSNVNYLRTYSRRRTLLSTRFSSFSSSSHSPANSLQMMQTVDNVESYTNDTLAILKLLSEHLHSGVEIGQKIFMNYRISINIEVPYQVVVMTTDYMKILKDALEDNCMNKIDVVHDFIWAYKWSKHEVADFICEELINSTASYVDSNNDHLTMWDLNIDQDFLLILQLLQDNCSVLGHKIYSYASTLHKSHIESDYSFKPSDLSLVIELLIRAHDCFTTDCNMEGISIVLKKSKEVVANLLILQDWKLMVRLLTGVARYTEMNYVFQILKENDQFEFLLRKNLRKDNTLKVALLEYLKKFCPDNRDLYKIVALHFTLFSEVAILWEREAQNNVKNLISISKLEMQNNKLNIDEEPFLLFENTQGTKICLNKAMENYIHATDFHLQGEKLTLAMNSAKQAELIALQLALLNEVPVNTSVVCLLNLKSGQIAELITSKLSFEQSLILVEAYNFHADWASILYENYVVKNNATYLEDFLKHLPLTDNLAHDISRKFIVSSINSVSEIKCMKNILSRLPSLHVKYRIASELGFTDLVEDLIASGQLVYLKDTVWKKGYKS